MAVRQPARNLIPRKVVLLSRVARYTQPELLALERSGFDLVDQTGLGDTATEEQLISALAGAWAVVAGGEQYSRRVIQSLNALRAIARTGIGFDAIDVEAASKSRIAVTVTPGANSESVADFAIALILACLRSTLAADNAVRSGAWRLDIPGRDLFRATVGIVGFGRVGQALARRLNSFDCRLLVVESTPDAKAIKELGVELVSLEAMLPQVDVLSLHVPLTAETRHLIGAPELRRMRQNAVVINTSRGAVIEGPALLTALRDEVIGGAGLDVFEVEPLADTDELTKLHNVVLAGHISSFTQEAMTRMMVAASASLVELAAGHVPSGCINPDAVRPARAEFVEANSTDG